MLDNLYVYNFSMDCVITIRNFNLYTDDKLKVTVYCYSDIKHEKVIEKTKEYKFYFGKKGAYFKYRGTRIYTKDFIRVY